MTDQRKEDILVRIKTDYEKALADLQRFTGAFTKGVDGVTPSVQNVNVAFDRLIERLDKTGRSEAFDKITRKVKETNSEASRLSKTFDSLLATGKGIGAAMAAWQAGKAVLAPSVNKTMDYDMRLAFATNIAMPTGTVAQKYAVEKEINTKLEAARNYGGGKREDILEAYEALVGRGAIGDKDQSLQVMPGIVKTAYTAHATPKDMANAASGLVMGLKVAPKDVELGLAQLFYSGQTGGFEVRDMAKFIGKQAGFAHQAGYKGLSGNATVAALNQIGFNFAGSADEAGTNVTDFLKSMTSAHLGQNLKRFSYDKENHTLVKDEGNKRKGKNYLDLGAVLSDNQAKGVNSIDTMIEIMQMINEGNPKLKAAAKKLGELNKKIDEARKKGDETSKIQLMLEAKDNASKAVDILKGSSAGQLFHNQQEMLGFLGVLADPEGFKRSVKNTEEHGNLATVSGDHQFLSAHAGYKAEMYGEDKAAALYQGMGKFNDTLGDAAQGLSGFYQRHPVFAAALESGKLAVNTLAASAVSAAFIMTMLSKNATSASAALARIGLSGPAANNIPGAVNSGAAGKAAGNLFKTQMKGAAALALVNTGIQAYSVYSDDALTSQQKKVGYAGAVGSGLGALGGMAAGAALGSIFPGLGTVVGGAIGLGFGIAGSMVGSKAGTMAGESMFGDSQDNKAAKALEQSIKDNPIEMKGKLLVEFRNGQLVMADQTLSGKGFRLDVGTMMAN